MNTVNNWPCIHVIEVNGIYFADHFPLLVELEMTPTVPASSNGLISRR